MKTLRKEFNNVEGGCSFGYMMSELLEENGIKKVRLEKTWDNKKTVFLIENKKYIIGTSSYIFNYDGIIDLDEFFGKTRKLNNKKITSSYRFSNYEAGDFFIICE